MRNLAYAFGLALAVSATAALASSFSAEGDFSTFGSSLDWEPNCNKPTRPYGRDQYAVDRYFDEAKRYVACVNDQAKEDAEYAVAQIREGRDDAIEEMLSEARSLR
ncbi:hypothetical protein [Phenylobacterium sp.]|uniref:hypothetical protein n=1 Tax=Phenylobacterium sp. TaxID=1871053 RepID=UPI003BAD2D77